MKRWLLLWLMMLCTLPSVAQVGYYYGKALAVNPFPSAQGAYQTTGTFGPISYGQVRVCTAPASGIPCTPLATNITDTFGNTLSVAGGNFGQVFTSVQGDYNFGCSVAGNYYVQIEAQANNTPTLAFYISCGAGSSSGASGISVFFGNTGTAGVLSTFLDPTTLVDTSGDFLAFSTNEIAFGDTVGDGCSATLGTLNCKDGSGDFMSLSDGVAKFQTASGASFELTSSEYILNDGTANTLVSTGGKVTATNLLAPTFRLSFDASLYTTGSAGTCTLGTNDNVCIQNAIAAIVGVPGTSGGYGIIDATELGSGGTETWTTNPFDLIISNPSTYGNFTSPQKCGTLILNSGHNIPEAAPMWVPRCWDVVWTTMYSQGGRGITTSSAWTTTITGTGENPAGTLISSGQYQFVFTASAAFSTLPIRGQMFAVCGSTGANGPGCGGNGQTTCGTLCGNSAWGIILAATSTTVTVGANNTSHALANNTAPVNFVIWGDLVSLGSVSQTGSDAGGSSSTITGGAYSCNNNSNGVVGYALSNFSVQEKSYWRHVIVQNCGGSSGTQGGSYMTVQGSGSVNSGPYDEMVMNMSSSCQHTTLPVIVRVPAGFAMKAFQNFTINADVNNCADVAIDWEVGGTLRDFHIEMQNSDSNVNTAVSIGNNTGGVPIVSGASSAAVICPVMCVEPSNSAQAARVENASITGTWTNEVYIGSQTGVGQSVSVLNIEGSGAFTNVINDTGYGVAGGSGCIISGATGSGSVDNWIQLYSRNGANGKVLSTANSNASTCPTTVQRNYNTASATGSASLGLTTIWTTPSAGGTQYFRINFYAFQVGVGAGGACSTATTLTTSITFTDPNASATATVPIANLTTTTAAGTANEPMAPVSSASNSYTFEAKANTTIRYSTTVTAGNCTTQPTYFIIPFLEQL
jgi:hypothetical protein